MPLYFNDLESKAEAAGKALVENFLSYQGIDSATLPVFVGHDGRVSLTLPRVEVKCTGGEEFPHNSQNFWMTFEITLFSTCNGSDALSNHRTWLGYVRDSCIRDGVERDLSNVGIDDFGCMGVKDRTFPRLVKEDAHFESSFEFQGLCATCDLV